MAQANIGNQQAVVPAQGQNLDKCTQYLKKCFYILI